MSDFLFTSESVSEGHPDKVADQISDAVLDAILAQDPRSRVAAETLVKNNLEMCYGVAARGKNDCAEGQHSCVGQATRDREPDSFVLVPKGDCQKLAGGKTKAS